MKHVLVVDVGTSSVRSSVVDQDGRVAGLHQVATLPSSPEPGQVEFDAHALADEVRISGPAPAPLERLQGQWRFQILLRSASATRLRRVVAECVPASERADVLIDVDPQDLF